MRFRFSLLLLAPLLWCAPPARAQIEVGLQVPERLFMAYEPIMATVSVTNLTGRDVSLHDAEGQKWFGFQIDTQDDRLVGPRDPNYQLDPMDIPAGGTIKRSVNLAALFPVTDYGLYHVRATIYFSDLQRYFSSQIHNVEVTEGQTIWQQTVGVPGETNAYRHIELLLHRLTKQTALYVRVKDNDAGIMYGTYRLGPIIYGTTPQTILDKNNQLHVLQMSAPKTYLYSKIGPSAEWNGQVTYNEVASRPLLRKLPDGSVQVRGGEVDAPVAQGAGGKPVPKLSDRPAGMPQ